MPGSDHPGVEQGGLQILGSRPAPSAGTFGGITHVSINSRTRLAALGLVAAFAIGACSGGGATASPSAEESTAAESAAPAESTAAESPTAGGPPECLSFADIYALVGPESEDVQTWDQAATIATELGSNTQFPAGLPIAITAPGEESGTFDSFVDVVLGDYLEEREQGDATTRLSNYQSSSDDNAIIDGIANSAGSFGWVGFAFYEENLDRVRAFSIAADPNGTCVEPTAETIASNEYPIARDLFIYVNKAKLAENPAMSFPSRAQPGRHSRVRPQPTRTARSP
jgi:PBP superfamily domain